MVVEMLRLGLYQTNCYLLHNHRNVWIIDPGFDGKIIAQRIRVLGLHPAAVLLTHAHWDHVMGLPDLVSTWPGLPILVHESEVCYLGPEGARRLLRLASKLDPGNAQGFASIIGRLPAHTGTVGEGDTLADCGILVLHTPGHTPGSVSYLRSTDNMLFSGDTLFRSAVGRTNLPGGSARQLAVSLREKLFTLPGETTVFPGHGASTTIAAEKKHPWIDPEAQM